MRQGRLDALIVEAGIHTLDLEVRPQRAAAAAPPVRALAPARPGRTRAPLAVLRPPVRRPASRRRQRRR